eukprot:8140317-Pyramimonas_sp.AAC.1
MKNAADTATASCTPCSNWLVLSVGNSPLFEVTVVVAPAVRRSRWSPPGRRCPETQCRSWSRCRGRRTALHRRARARSRSRGDSSSRPTHLVGPPRRVIEAMALQPRTRHRSTQLSARRSRPELRTLPTTASGTGLAHALAPPPRKWRTCLTSA